MKHQSETLIFRSGTTVEFKHGSANGTIDRLYVRYGKRLCDVVLTCIFLPAFLMLIVPIAVLVMLDGGKPFFGHKRVGRNGKPFKCWKLRSMVPNAEARLVRHLAENPAARAEWEANYKLENDPRITRFGRFLRRSSLDELPQIWNIVRGEMSWVGPRPVITDELNMYGKAATDYKAIRPGLTGLWQISGRNDLSYDERVHLDMRYRRECSLAMDIKIVVRTILAVLGRTGR
ncbi:sugar transferase [Paracoccus benzoatiresistens]|uniref:Sugar transferase n=1 Tax=Paracoccus benzoatiresistens TaxID=2997341 RepID=A0ABT4JB56_9RHOB|nr:sugar transferase [Paracoccus sp. EF6]MCZ0964368.1 sugar transferase [Paracoccus sp. EF6]